jgi:hypothetical protein
MALRSTTIAIYVNYTAQMPLSNRIVVACMDRSVSFYDMLTGMRFSYHCSAITSANMTSAASTTASTITAVTSRFGCCAVYPV